jgi:hypothetical protein
MQMKEQTFMPMNFDLPSFQEMSADTIAEVLLYFTGF